MSQEHLCYDIQADVTGKVISKFWPIRRRGLAVIIILLHILTTINFAVQWSSICSAFIENGQSFWTVYSEINGTNQAFIWQMGIAATMNTILADSYIVCITLLVIVHVSLHLFGSRFGAVGRPGAGAGTSFYLQSFA